MTLFTKIHQDQHSNARAGILKTDRGDLQTPLFMPVGTSATVKAVHQKELDEVIKAQIILGNTYHLYLRPGMDIMRSAGGLHSFMAWDKPILTDSGGYQVYSLSSRRKITPEGVKFQSHIDGSSHFFSPESVVDIQRTLGSDIMMALDECTPYPCDRKYAQKSLKLTNDWLERGYKRFEETSELYGKKQIFVPISQGSLFEDLRKASSEFNAQFDSPLYAIGGLSVGEPEEELYRMTEVATSNMPIDRGRYLMGVGTPANLLECIGLGIDLFDCVLPTRNARHGILYTSEGTVHIRNQKWKDDFNPIDPNSMAETSRTHTKAYLRHLFMVSEILGAQLASIQNLSFYLQLMKSAREQILTDQYIPWKLKTISLINRKL
ncbi:MAG: tRNA guanosine(34) transglycosylase Tgt [Saprospiraceae bacterium]|nr:tRNA guanosine(34) transglycosylase Tgt [Saprospiraceae bacterium]